MPCNIGIILCLFFHESFHPTFWGSTMLMFITLEQVLEIVILINTISLKCWWGRNKIVGQGYSLCSCFTRSLVRWVFSHTLVSSHIPNICMLGESLCLHCSEWVRVWVWVCVLWWKGIALRVVLTWHLELLGRGSGHPRPYTRISRLEKSHLTCFYSSSQKCIAYIYFSV